MGVLPCQFVKEESAASLGLDGTEEFDLVGLNENAKPRQSISLFVIRKDGRKDNVFLIVRLDTTAEIDYVKKGGILQYQLSRLGKQSQ